MFSERNNNFLHIQPKCIEATTSHPPRFDQESKPQPAKQVLDEVLPQTGQFGELHVGREGHGKVLLTGIFCTLCVFSAGASLHLSFNLLCYLLETNLNN